MIKWKPSAAKPRLEKWWRIWARVVICEKIYLTLGYCVPVLLQVSSLNYHKIDVPASSPFVTINYRQARIKSVNRWNWFLINGVLMFHSSLNWACQLEVLLKKQSARENYTHNRHLSFLNCTFVPRSNVFDDGDSQLQFVVIYRLQMELFILITSNTLNLHVHRVLTERVKYHDVNSMMPSAFKICVINFHYTLF